ncbi:hypothetical protein ACFLYT_01505, partial [Nanoarchaeota archaeon]
YLHGLSQLDPYSKHFKKNVKGIKVKKTEKDNLDIEDLIKNIMDAASDSVKEHFGDGEDVQFKIEYDRLITFLEENEKDILDEDGNLSDEVIQGIVGQYVGKANNYLFQKYGSRLSQMHIDEAKEVVKGLAKFTGKEQQYGIINRTKKVDTLLGRVQNEYVEASSKKVKDMHEQDHYIQEKGWKNFIDYKYDNVAKPGKYKNTKSNAA